MSYLTLFAELEAFITNLHSYFSHSLKHHLEFQKFVIIVETKGNKMWWVSMLNPLKKIASKHKLLLAIMQVNQTSIQLAKVNVKKPFFYFFRFSIFYFYHAIRFCKTYSNLKDCCSFEEWQLINKPNIYNFFYVLYY